MHGGPLLDTSHRTLRVRHERHARAARRRLVASDVDAARGLAAESRVADMCTDESSFVLRRVYSLALFVG